MRVIGMDVHRTFAQVVFLEDGQCRSGDRVPLTATALNGFGQQLNRSDVAVLEATCNSSAVARVLGPHVARVVVANPLQVKAIAHAKVKTDKVDAAMLAKLYASGFLPEIWTPDPFTEAPRRQVVPEEYQERRGVSSLIYSLGQAFLQ